VILTLRDRRHGASFSDMRMNIGRARR
jgi:hypothetical protein